MHKNWVGGVALVLAGCAATPPPPAEMAGPWQGWQEYSLPGKRSTQYRASREGDRLIVQADAQASASMLRRKLHIEPGRVGTVQFSWRVASLIAKADLRESDVSDSPVRLVFAFDGDPGRLSARNRMLFELAQAITGEAPPHATLMYVWDNHAAPESVIHSGRTDRVRKIVIESGSGQCGRWLTYQRDLLSDFRKAFGEEPGALIGVALMTDADNTGTRASGHYGEVRLLGRDGRPL